MEQKLIEQGKVPEEQLDAAIEMMSKFQKPIILSVSSIFGGALTGLIISLITSIFTKKEPGNEVPE